MGRDPESRNASDCQTRFSCEAPKRNPSCPHWLWPSDADFRLLDSRTVWKQICIFLSCQGHCNSVNSIYTMVYMSFLTMPDFFKKERENDLTTESKSTKKIQKGKKVRGFWEISLSGILLCFIQIFLQDSLSYSQRCTPTCLNFLFIVSSPSSENRSNYHIIGTTNHNSPLIIANYLIMKGLAMVDFNKIPKYCLSE